VKFHPWLASRGRVEAQEAIGPCPTSSTTAFAPSGPCQAQASTTIVGCKRSCFSWPITFATSPLPITSQISWKPPPAALNHPPQGQLPFLSPSPMPEILDFDDLLYEGLLVPCPRCDKRHRVIARLPDTRLDHVKCGRKLLVVGIDGRLLPVWNGNGRARLQQAVSNQAANEA